MLPPITTAENADALGPPRLTGHPSPGGVGSDSIPALGTPHARIEFRAVPLSELGPSEPPTWLWHGYLARGHTTLFSGLWKAGKSTLLGHLLRDLSAGGGLVGSPIVCPTLVVSEESASLWCRRRDDLELPDSVHVAIRPFMAKPDALAWHRLIEWIAEEVRTKGYGLVVLDTLPACWPVVNENDAAEVGAALMPLHAITQAGAALMLVHHPRKGGGSEGTAARGSGALPGFVDIIVELRRFAPEDQHDRRRVLTCLGRFEECPPESVIELGNDGYRVIGERSDAERTDRLSVIAGVLADGNALTADEVRERWPSEPKPGKRRLAEALAEGHKNGRWGRSGTGTRGDPYRYSRPEFDSGGAPSLGASIESKPSSKADRPFKFPTPDQLSGVTPPWEGRGS